MTPGSRRAAVLAVLCLIVAGACSGGDDEDQAESSISTAELGTTSTAADDDDDVAAPPSSGCAAEAESSAPDTALEVFPDNPDVTWTVLDVTEPETDRVLVELEPRPDEVGYPSFQLLYACDDGEPVRLATYALDGGTYVLLATTDAAPGDLPPTLP